MHPHFTSLLRNFVIGGSVVASVSYLATFQSPLVAAILWSYPFTILPSVYFMQHHGKSNKDISKFLLGTTYALVLLVACTYLLSRFLKTNTIGMSISKATGCWLAISLLFFGLIRHFKFEHFFS